LNLGEDNLRALISQGTRVDQLLQRAELAGESCTGLGSASCRSSWNDLAEDTGLRRCPEARLDDRILLSCLSCECWFALLLA